MKKASAPAPKSSSKSAPAAAPEEKLAYRNLRKYTHVSLSALLADADQVARLRKLIRSKESGPFLAKELIKGLIALEAEKKDWSAAKPAKEPKAKPAKASTPAKAAKAVPSKPASTVESSKAKLASLKGKLPAPAKKPEAAAVPSKPGKAAPVAAKPGKPAKLGKAA